MKKSFSLTGHILTPTGWVNGALLVENGKIAGIEGKLVTGASQADAPYILPGFVDLHVHGGGGFDCLEGEEATRQMVAFHARNGTVGILPTTSTAPADLVERSLRNIAAAMSHQSGDAAEILGAHLEGPFINPARLGAQEAPLDGDPTLARAWGEICPLRVATVAPEIPGGMAVARALASNGTRVQVGHSIATEAVLREAFASGFTGFTHLFNAMTPFDHKASGIAAFAMAHGGYAEIIGDLRHVHPTALTAAVRAIPQLYAITDAVGVAGLPDGEHTTRGGRRAIVKKGMDIFLKNQPDTRSGSAATMIDVFKNLVSLGLSMELASAMTSTRPANYIGASELGRLQPGAKASVVVLDQALDLEAVYVNGSLVPHFQAAA